MSAHSFTATETVLRIGGTHQICAKPQSMDVPECSPPQEILAKPLKDR